VGTLVFAEVPYPNITRLVAGNEFALVRVDNDVVDGRAVGVVALDHARSRVPDLDRSVLRGCHHPLSLTMKSHSSDVIGVALELEDGIRVRRLDVVEAHCGVTRRRKKPLVRGDAKPINLRVSMLNCSRADAGKRLPKPIGH
jgi:hypothetical protein